MPFSVEDKTWRRSLRDDPDTAWAYKRPITEHDLRAILDALASYGMRLRGGTASVGLASLQELVAIYKGKRHKARQAKKTSKGHWKLIEPTPPATEWTKWYTSHGVDIAWVDPYGKVVGDEKLPKRKQFQRHTWAGWRLTTAALAYAGSKDEFPPGIAFIDESDSYGKLWARPEGSESAVAKLWSLIGPFIDLYPLVNETHVSTVLRAMGQYGAWASGKGDVLKAVDALHTLVEFHELEAKGASYLDRNRWTRISLGAGVLPTPPEWTNWLADLELRVEWRKDKGEATPPIEVPDDYSEWSIQLAADAADAPDAADRPERPETPTDAAGDPERDDEPEPLRFAAVAQGPAGCRIEISHESDADQRLWLAVARWIAGCDVQFVRTDHLLLPGRDWVAYVDAANDPARHPPGDEPN